MQLATAASAATALPADAWRADRSSCELRAASHAVVPMLAHGAADFMGVRAWTRLGTSCLWDYTRESFDRSDRWLREFASLGRAIIVSPQLERALLGWDGGAPIGRVAAAHLARVAPPESMDQWIRLARTRTVRQLSEATAACRAMGVEAFETFELNDAASENASSTGSEPAAPSSEGAFHVGSQPAAPTSEGASSAGPKAVATLTEGAIPEDSSSSEFPARPLDASDPAGLEEEFVERTELRFDAPETVRAAFYETLDVHRAISGYESTVRSFWEALAAEASAGLFPPDVASTPVRRGISTRIVEHAMARATENWGHLDPIPAAASATSPVDAQGIAASQGAHGTGIRFPKRRVPDDGGADFAAGEVSPLELERQVQVLLACDDAIERRLGDVLYGMSERNDWATLGFTSLGHYATERLGIPRSTAYARVALLRALKRRPHILDAYREGVIGFEAAQVLVDILESQPFEARVERAWIEQAQGVSVKRLRAELQYFRRQALDGNTAVPMPLDPEVSLPEASTERSSGSSTGSSTASPTGASDAPHANGSRLVRMPLPDAVWDQSLRRAPGDTLDRLARLHVPGEDPSVPTSSAFENSGSAMRFRLPTELADRVLATLEAARQRVTAQVMPLVDDDTVDLQGLAPSKRGALVALQRGRRVPTWVGMLALLEDFAVTWDNPEGFPKREKDAVYQRAGFRCQAPGCTRRCNIEDHHLVYRSHQGSDELWNQLCLCRFHHQQGEHGLFAHCQGQAPLDVLWRLGEKDCGVYYRNERLV